MPNVSEWTREGDDREADVHQPHHCNGTAHASGTAGLWQEIQALTKERDALRAIVCDLAQRVRKFREPGSVDADAALTWLDLVLAPLATDLEFYGQLPEDTSVARIADLESRYEIAQDERDSALNRNCELTEKLDLLESQLATANALMEDWKRAAKEHRAELKQWLSNES